MACKIQNVFEIMLTLARYSGSGINF